MRKGFEYRNAIQIVLIPIGNLSNELFDHYSSILQLCQRVSIDSLTRPGGYSHENSPLEHFSWDKGYISFNFVPFSGVLVENLGETMQAHLKIIGAIGICHCPTSPNLNVAYEQFTASLANAPHLIIKKLFAFENQFEDRTLNDFAANLEDLIMFPVDKVIGDGLTSIQLHMEVVLNTITVTIISSIEKIIKKGMNLFHDKIVSSSFTKQKLSGMDLKYLCIDDEFSSDTRNKKQRNTRLRKYLGDYCLLIGSPLDAQVHYEHTIEVSRQIGDSLYLAGALECLSSCLVLTKCMDWVSRKNTCLFLAEIVEKCEEAQIIYSKLRHSALELDLIMKLSLYLASTTPTPKKQECLEWLNKAHCLSAEMSVQDRAILMLDCAFICKKMHLYRKYALYLQEASVIYQELGLWNNAHFLALVASKCYLQENGPNNRPDNGPNNGPDNRPDNGSKNNGSKNNGSNNSGPDNRPDNRPDYRPKNNVPKNSHGWNSLRFLLMQQLVLCSRYMDNHGLETKYEVELLQLLGEMAQDTLKGLSLVHTYPSATANNSRKTVHLAKRKSFMTKIAEEPINSTTTPGSLSTFDRVRKPSRFASALQTPRLVAPKLNTPRFSSMAAAVVAHTHAKKDFFLNVFQTSQPQNDFTETCHAWNDYQSILSWQTALVTSLLQSGRTLPSNFVSNMKYFPSVNRISPRSLTGALVPLDRKDLDKNSQKIRKDNAFFYSPFEKKENKKKEIDHKVEWIQDEVASVAIYMDNPLSIPLVIHSARLIVEGCEAECYPVTLSLHPNTKNREVILAVKCLSVGECIVKGVHIRALNLSYDHMLHSKEQTITILPRIPLLVVSEHSSPFTSLTLLNGERKNLRILIENIAATSVGALGISLELEIQKKIAHQNHVMTRVFSTILYTFEENKKTTTNHEEQDHDKDQQQAQNENQHHQGIQDIVSWDQQHMDMIQNTLPLKTRQSISLPLTIAAQHCCTLIRLHILYSVGSLDQLCRHLTIPISMQVKPALNLLKVEILSLPSVLPHALLIEHHQRKQLYEPARKKENSIDMMSVSSFSDDVDVVPQKKLASDHPVLHSASNPTHHPLLSDSSNRSSMEPTCDDDGHVHTDNQGCLVVLTINNTSEYPFQLRHILKESSRIEFDQIFQGRDLHSNVESLKSDATVQVNCNAVRRIVFPMRRIEQLNVDPIKEEDASKLFAEKIQLQWQSIHGNSGTLSLANLKLNVQSIESLTFPWVSFVSHPSTFVCCLDMFYEIPVHVVLNQKKTRKDEDIFIDLYVHIFQNHFDGTINSNVKGKVIHQGRFRNRKVIEKGKNSCLHTIKICLLSKGMYHIALCCQNLKTRQQMWSTNLFTLEGVA